MKYIITPHQHNEVYSKDCGVLVSGKASDEINYFIDKINKLEAENAKLEKCLRLFAFPEGTLEHEAVERAARQVLKELDKK